ncbi:MAG TPA: YfcE family phosphodiesterase [Phycisphaerae bacterium]|nr:YfcE family phosphodiesterase [Phycisphaerae bacterium]HNU46700.1 YfcE family phosphodiesterase [Phycisphaerae bacterium]
MLIGILSDTHGRTSAVRRALALFDTLGVQHVIHCGDVGGMGVLEELVGRPCTLVWGNVDLPDAATLAFLHAVGLPAPTDVPTIIELDGRRIAVWHGHEPGFHDGACGPDLDYVFHGHTHQRQDVRWGRTRIINPGALHRAHVRTVATLDLRTDELTFHQLE